MAQDSEAQKRIEEAIRARIDGEWDNPSLVAIGPLSIDPQEDIRAIIEHYSQGGE